MKIKTLLIVSIFLFVSYSTYAQEHPNQANAFDAEKLYDFEEIDSINSFNGSLSLNIPIGQNYLINGELKFSLALFYSSSVWKADADVSGTTKVTPGGPEDRIPFNAGLGWHISLGQLLVTSLAPNQMIETNYVAPDGTKHSFTKPFLGSLEDPGDGGSTQKIVYTGDGSFLRLRVLAGSKYAMDFPNGITHTFNSQGLLEKIEGPFNNASLKNQEISITYSADKNTWTITDSHGRIYRLLFRNTFLPSTSLTRVLDSIELTRFGDPFNSDPAIYRFFYTDTTMELPSPHLPRGQTVTVPLLTSIVLPNQASYSMPVSDYITNLPSEDSTRQGLITGITLPTRGRIVWAYQVYIFPSQSSLRRDRTSSQGVATRKIVDAANNVLGTWTYETSLRTEPSSQPKELKNTMTVDTAEAKFKTVNYFSVYPLNSASQNTWSVHDYGLPFTRYQTDGTTANPRFLSTQVYDGNEVLQRSTYVRFEYDRCCSIDVDEIGKLHRRLSSKRTLYNSDGGQGNQTFKDLDYSDYDGLGHYRTESTGGNLVNNNYRQVTTNYTGIVPVSNERWILDTYADQVITESGSLAKTEYCFDLNTGFLKRKRVLTLGASRAANDLITRYTPDANGNVQREEYFGGDKQSLATTALCGLGLPVPEYRIDHTYSFGSLTTSRYFNTESNTYLSFYTVDKTIDQNTGLTSHSRDSAGLETSFTYDKMGRVTLIQPFQDAHTSYLYNEATAISKASVGIHRINPIGGGVMAESKVTFDDYGRVFREEERIPGGRWSATETIYNALGWKLSESEPGATAKITQYLNYDPFGRASTVRPPEGSSHDTSFEYKGERVIVKTFKVGTALNSSNVTESLVQTVQRFDNQGRLVHFVEDFTLGGPGSIGFGVAQPVTTFYSYDIGNRLSRVETSAPVNATTVTQVRTFTYDNRGFSTSASHPEKGNSTANGVTSYSQYDSLGNLGQKNDVGHITTYLYDKASRLRSIKDAGGRLLKEFDYSNANTGSDKRNGKLIKTVRHNYVDPPFDPGTAEVDVAVTETYFYTGLNGRISQRTTSMSTGYSFTQGFSYTRLGLISSLTYPTCQHGSCTDEAQGTDLRSVTYGYAFGYLTSVTDSVTGAVSTVSYDWNKMVNQVGHANGVTDTIEVDPDTKMVRPHRIFTTGALNAAGTAAQEWDTSFYEYDGSGNVIGIGNDYYQYDRRGRLKEGTALSAGNKKQSYEYDLFGNMTRKVTSVNGVASTDNFTVNAAKNRITSSSNGGLTYGPRGNVTGQAGMTFKYDLFDQVQYQYNPNKIFIYTADDERVWTYDYSGAAIKETFSLRDLEGNLLREYLNQGGDTTGTWQVDKDYFYRGDVLLSSWNSNEGLRQFHVDHLGSPRLITNQNRRRVAFHTYYPFGQEATSQGQDTEKLKFTSHERDLNFAGEADDLDYMHARYYSPVLARFLSVDPVLGSPENPQSWNRYAYVLNNPLTLTDPRGESVEVMTMAIVGVVVVTATVAHLEAPSQVDKGKTNKEVMGEQIAAGVGAVASAMSTKRPANPYDVGPANDMRARSKPGDGLDNHHVPQSKPAGQVIPGYDPKTAPTISLPAGQHKNIPTLKGVYEGTVRDLAALTIKDLRKYTNASKEAVKKVLDEIKKAYGEHMKKPPTPKGEAKRKHGQGKPK